MTENTESTMKPITKFDNKTIGAALNEAIEVIVALQAKIEALEKAGPTERPVRDRGPVSERAMTEEDAERVLIGDLKDKSNRDAAQTLGLSYGQVYSARGGYTFKGVYKKAEDLKRAAQEESTAGKSQKSANA